MGRTSDRRGDRAFADVASEGVLSLVVDLTDEAVVSCDARSTVTFFSERAEWLFGRRLSDVLGTSVLSLFPSRLAVEMDRLFATVTSGEQVRNFEAEIVRRDGLPVTVSLSLAPLPGEAATRRSPHEYEHGWVMMAREVSEQHLPQAAAAEVDCGFEQGEADWHVGSWSWDLRTDAVRWSLEFHRIHDIDPLDFPGTFESYMDLIVSEDRDRVRSAMIRSVDTSMPLSLEYRSLDTDDKTRVIRVIANPALGADGAAVGLRGTGRDVTDRSPQGPDSDLYL